MLANEAEFKRALAQVAAVSKKTAAEVVNNTLKDVGLWAMNKTKFAPADNIEGDLRKDKLALKLAVIALKKKVGTPVMKKGKAVVYKRTGKVKVHGPLTRAKIAKEAKKIINVRRSHSKALRAGWIKSVEQLGYRVSGQGKRFPGGTAAQGYAKLATPGKLSGEIVNTLVTKNAHGTTDVSAIREAQQGLDAAVAEVTARNMAYAQRKIDQALTKLSDQ